MALWGENQKRKKWSQGVCFLFSPLLAITALLVAHFFPSCSEEQCTTLRKKDNIPVSSVKLKQAILRNKKLSPDQVIRPINALGSQNKDQEKACHAVYLTRRLHGCCHKCIPGVYHNFLQKEQHHSLIKQEEMASNCTTGGLGWY